MSPDNALISYDSRFDILYHNNGQTSHVSETKGRVTIDFTHDRDVVGVEVESASDFLSEVMGRTVSEQDIHDIKSINVTKKRIDGVLSVIIEIEMCLDGDMVEERTELSIESEAQAVA